MRKLVEISSILALAAAVGCGDGDDGDDGGDGSSDATTTIALAFDQLPELGADAVYEGWLITPTGPVSTGRFTVDASGALDPATSDVLSDTLADSSTFVLTIEPATGDDPAPAATHILAGDISGSTAALTTSHAAAIGTDFANAAGSYILATPSTADVDSDNPQGIWWLAPGDTPTASLVLPTLPEGWAYEGWVVDANGPTTTGRFTAVDAADSDAGGATAGPDGTPAFPGQDFIDPARNLVGGVAVISVEPEPDDSPAPFLIKPLVHDPIADVAPPAAQDMVNNAAATLPAGTATFTAQQ